MLIPECLAKLYRAVSYINYSECLAELYRVDNYLIFGMPRRALSGRTAGLGGDGALAPSRGPGVGWDPLDPGPLERRPEQSECQVSQPI